MKNVYKNRLTKTVLTIVRTTYSVKKRKKLTAVITITFVNRETEWNFLFIFLNSNVRER